MGKTMTESETRHQLWEKFENSPNPFPVNVVAIETIGNCNRSCGYCPVSTHPKRLGRMDTEIVYSLFDQLGDLNYDKKLVFHFYNEPLLDKRIDNFVEYAAQKTPNAFRLLTTNGDLLNLKKIEYLLDGRVTKVAISAHDRETFARFREIKDGLEPAYKNRLDIRSYFRVGDGQRAARITNRGGNIDLDTGGYSVDEVTEAGPEGCDRVEFNIDYKGDVHPCCMDFSGEYVLGNVNEESLLGIWSKSVQQFKGHFNGNYTKSVCFRCAKICAPLNS